MLKNSELVINLSVSDLLFGFGEFTERKKRIRIEEIADRLAIGRLAVYALLEQGESPAIRLGRRVKLGRKRTVSLA